MKVLIHSLIAATLLANQARAQSQYVFDPSPSVSANSIPFNSTYNCRQWLYYPSNFPTMPAGNITAIYLKASTGVTPSFTFLQIRMGNTTLNNFTSGPYASGLTMVYCGAYTAAANIGGWIKINLQTPFYYDSLQNFVVECAQLGYAPGFSVYQANNTVPGVSSRSMWGYMTSATGSSQNGLGVISFDIQSNQNPLSVNIRNLSVSNGSGRRSVNWIVSDENNIDRYEVERSFDGGTFDYIGTKYALGGSGDEIEYSFTDLDNSSGNQKAFYRLRIVEYGGTSYYSRTVESRQTGTEGSLEIAAAPIPFQNDLDLITNAKEEGLLSFSLVDATGKLMVSQNQQVFQGGNRISLHDMAGWASGVYFLKARIDDVEQQLKIYKE